MKPIHRGTGTTPSERHLLSLCENTFLDLWSYPNVYYKKPNEIKSYEKEVCDLIAVSGRDVFVFSDKEIKFNEEIDVERAWSRWQKKAIHNSVKQINGAFRILSMYPDHIYTDEKCEHKLPIVIPNTGEWRLHGIVVARGAGTAISKHADIYPGTLHVFTQNANDRENTDENLPIFCVGDVNYPKSFIHIFDDYSLEIILREFDTISDFSNYLCKRERFLRSNTVFSKAEKNLCAYFMAKMNRAEDRHDFVGEDGHPISDEAIYFDDGFYEETIRDPQYLYKKARYKSSYFFDQLIKQFTKYIISGEIADHTPGKKTFANIERSVRALAEIPRHERMMFAEGMIDWLRKHSDKDRAARTLFSGSSMEDAERIIVFVLLGPPKKEEFEYEKYLEVRRATLSAYALCAFQRFRPRRGVIAIGLPSKLAVERYDGASEDLVFLPPENWTESAEQSAREAKELLDIYNEGRETVRRGSAPEYPKDYEVEYIRIMQSNLSRQQKRERVRKLCKYYNIDRSELQKLLII